MVEYLISSLALATFGTVLYNASHSALREGMRTAIGLVLALFMLSPLALLVGEAIRFEFPKTENVENDLYAETLEGAFCRGIATARAERYGIESDCFEVSAVELDMESMHSSSIRVVLSGKARGLDYNAVRLFVMNSVDTGGCVVEYKIN